MGVSAIYQGRAPLSYFTPLVFLSAGELTSACSPKSLSACRSIPNSEPHVSV